MSTAPHTHLESAPAWTQHPVVIYCRECGGTDFTGVGQATVIGTLSLAVRHDEVSAEPLLDSFVLHPDCDDLEELWKYSCDRCHADTDYLPELIAARRWRAGDRVSAGIGHEERVEEVQPDPMARGGCRLLISGGWIDAADADPVPLYHVEQAPLFWSS
jgi:hypothetical protein